MDFSWPVTPVKTFESCSALGIMAVPLKPGRPYVIRLKKSGIFAGTGVSGDGFLLVGVVNKVIPGGNEIMYPAKFFVPYDPPKAEAKTAQKVVAR